ncbi:MAG: hypothetical protein V4671_19490 [Armatimonadota bacterium]
MSLFDDTEPAMRRLTRGELTRAYAEALKDRPPVKSCAGDGPKFDKTRMVIAVKDITRLYLAAAKLGCTLQLVPLQNVPADPLNVSAPPDDNRGGQP